MRRCGCKRFLQLSASAAQTRAAFCSGRKMSADEFEGTLLRKQEWESTTKKTPCGSRYESQISGFLFKGNWNRNCENCARIWHKKGCKTRVTEFVSFSLKINQEVSFTLADEFRHLGFAALFPLSSIFATRWNVAVACIGTFRTWIRVYVVLKGRQISFHNSESVELTYGSAKSEPSLDLVGCTAKVAVDYTKKQHVFRLRWTFTHPKIFALILGK